MAKSLFGISGDVLMGKPISLNVRKFEPKNQPAKQVIDLKFETLITPERLVDSPYMESAFEVLPVAASTQTELKGAPAKPKARYNARPGSEVSIGATDKDFALLLKGSDNAAIIDMVNNNSLEPMAGGDIRLHPQHGITLKQIVLDADKKTVSPTAKLILMVKGLPSTLGAVPWLEFESITLTVAGKSEAEVNAEVKVARAKKAAKGQKDLEEVAE